MSKVSAMTSKNMNNGTFKAVRGRLIWRRRRPRASQTANVNKSIIWPLSSGEVRPRTLSSAPRGPSSRANPNPSQGWMRMRRKTAVPPTNPAAHNNGSRASANPNSNRKKTRGSRRSIRLNLKPSIFKLVYTRERKNATVCARPSARFTFGSQPNTRFALLISGRRTLGSSIKRSSSGLT